jgi:hypothetical protein
LLRPPVVGDNAAMLDPSNAEPPKRKRRWFQFSLRSLLVVVTLFSLVCACATRNRRDVKEWWRRVTGGQVVIIEPRAPGSDD